MSDANASEQGIIQDSKKNCVNGCGFYGSAATSDMCSKCWRDTVSKQQQQLMETPRKEIATAQVPSASLPPLEPPAPPAPAEATATASPASELGASSSASVTPPAPPAGGSSEGGASADGGAALAAMVVDGEVAGAEAEAAAAEAAEPAQKNRKRCFSCNKKVGLTGIECRCKLVFCGVHRYPEQHACQFDFKTVDRANLAQTVKGGGQFAKVDRL